MNSGLGLVRYDAARHALQEAKRVDEVKDIKDKAEAIRAYGVQSKDTELVSWASEIKLRAMRQMGALLDEMENAGERSSGGQPTKERSTRLTVLSDLGITKNLSSASQKIAAVPEQEFESHLSEMREEQKEITVAGVGRLIQAGEREKKAAGLSHIPLPKGKYRVIYADPPWKYGNSGVITEDDNYGRAERHYPPMSISELCALDVKRLSANHSVLFLWSTSPLLEDSFQVINAWGFKYKSSFVWHKLRHNYAHYNSMRHEFLLIATRGSCLPDSKKLIPSVVEEKRLEHSQKPERFREIIDEMYLPARGHCDRIELFSRAKLPSHWKPWGNESTRRK